MSITQDHRLVERTRDECATAIDIINEEIGREARARGWCTEYERFVERVNGRVGFDVLSPCARRIEVTIAYNVPRFWGADRLEDAVREAVLTHAGMYRDQVGDIAVSVVEFDSAGEAVEL